VGREFTNEEQETVMPQKNRSIDRGRNVRKNGRPNSSSRGSRRAAAATTPNARRRALLGRQDRRGEDLSLARVEDLLLQTLETELGGVQVYEAALECAMDPDLHEEWEKYLEQTNRHVEVIRSVLADLGVDSVKETPGRAIVRAKGEALLAAMTAAAGADDPVAAELVAAECVVDAETKDHANWEMIGLVAKRIEDPDAKRVLAEAHDEVEDEEDEHLYHTMGWARELWIDALGMPAELPPPEEEKHVRTMAAAAKAKSSRKPN
jgi:ferritin-like metal-binding protein YciE